MIFIDESHYDYSNADNGLCVDIGTGEVKKIAKQIRKDGETETVICYPDGAILSEYLITEAQERDRKRRQTQHTQTRAGNSFIFVACNGFDGLNAETLSRLVYLGTYLNFNSGRIEGTSGKRITISQLPKLLNVSERTAYRFIDSTERFLTVADDGIILNNDYIIRGSIGTGKEYRKVYRTKYRELFKRSVGADHKYIGYALLTLKYLNIHHNLMCFNPEELHMDSIERLTVRDFLSAVGADSQNAMRSIRKMDRLQFTAWDGAQKSMYEITDGGIYVAREVISA